MSDLFFEGRGRPAVGGALALFERRLESVEEKARLVEEEIAFAVFLGLRIPYKLASDAMVLLCSYDKEGVDDGWYLNNIRLRLFLQAAPRHASEFAGQKSARNRGADPASERAFQTYSVDERL